MHRAVGLKGCWFKTAEEDFRGRQLKAPRDWLKATSSEKMPMICQWAERSFFIARKITIRSREGNMGACCVEREIFVILIEFIDIRR
jgi:hypothetical protein